MKLKIRRKEYEITSRDRFMDNGSCVQLLTQNGPWKNWGYTTPVLSKKAIKELHKFKIIEHEHNYGSNVSIFSIEE